MIVRNAVVAVLVAVSAVGCSTATPPEEVRRSEVAAKGSTVMPFDLDRTTHRFTPRPDGLLQEVVADEPGDTAQVGLVREHLTAEAERFRRGDFTDPASIHGDDMPGLAELSAGAAAITVDRLDLPAGASLTFRTTDPALVAALHAWGEAQVSDHGGHAEHGTS